ncbi:MAG: GAF domain-containing protein [Alkalispirochaeta sp.]
MISHTAAPLDAEKILTACSSLLQNPTPETISRVLGQVGTATDVDRVYIFEITGDETVYASQRYEWSSEGVDPQIDNPELQMIPLRASGYGRWLDELERSRPVVGAIAEFPEEERPTLESQGILSLLILPIYVGGRLWGFVGFDDCTQGRRWTNADVDALIALTVALGRALAEDSAADDSVGTTIEGYLHIVGRLLQVHGVLFEEIAATQLKQRAHVRLRVVSQSYQFVSRAVNGGLDEKVDLQTYLPALRPLFEDVVRGEVQVPAPRIGMEVESLSLTLAHALDIAIVLGEVLAVTAERALPGLSEGSLTVSVHPRGTAVEVTVTGRTSNGVPVGSGGMLDGPAAALVRDVRQRFDLTVSHDVIDGLLVRLTFPRGE